MSYVKPMANSHRQLFTILGLLRRTNVAASLTEIAKAIHIAPSSAHAILGVLVEQGAVTVDGDKRYSLGPTTFYLGASYARNSRLHRTTWNDLVQLAHALDLAAAISVPWDEHHLVLAVHQNGGPKVGVGIGSRMPLDAGSYGKAYRAWSGSALPAKLTAYTPKSITDLKKYRQEIDVARARGYATDKEEFATGVGSIAVGVTGDSGYVGLIALMGTIEHIDEVGFQAAGGRLAALASWASVVLGDTVRETVWGEDH